MTAKASKFLLKTTGKSAFWFLSINALIMVFISILLRFSNSEDTSWLPITMIFSLKIYNLVIGIVYPLVALKLYVSFGLTRKQFFWGYIGAVSIMSLLMLLLIIALEIYNNNISLISVITHYLQLLLYFLIGWTAVLGFQMKKWYKSIIGLFSAIILLNVINNLTNYFSLSNVAVLGLLFSLLVAGLLILPYIISKIPIKS